MALFAIFLSFCIFMQNGDKNAPVLTFLYPLQSMLVSQNHVT